MEVYSFLVNPMIYLTTERSLHTLASSEGDRTPNPNLLVIPKSADIP
jgi:hypothetical protein